MNDNDKAWTLAKLTNDQLQMVKKAEQTLGPDYLLVFEATDLDKAEVQVADLNQSQLDCLQGLEQALHMTVVAYEKR
ncbi:MAG: hypothetical protein M5U01_27555 [Ardenticatenaceae bacterium]|nr:hypothetical protein [Ardenticatenaceae bacterium]HBY94553.1 hypothetical protein [Chloroflexota bacterium]